MTAEATIAAFESLHPLLMNRANSFHITTGVPFDELHAEARLALAIACTKFSRRYGVRLEGYASRVIHNRLVDFSRRWQHHEPLEHEDIIPDHDHDHHERLTDKLAGASEEAQMVAKMVLDTPGEFIDTWGARGRIRRRLRTEGWSWPAIQRAMAELKHVLA
jgi:DNA-directed RNA polymerase specialized sigma subunit